ncbi:mitochondrial mRNA pseudouridine synthase RPUSD3 [Gastrophryne carolinensis]
MGTHLNSYFVITDRNPTEPMYQEHLQEKHERRDSGHKTRPKAQEEKYSILRNPGVPNLSKLSKGELCQHLTQNVVYREGPLVAISKPQGLPITGSSEGPSVVSLLPDLQQSLQIQSELHIVKAAPKESSGLVLLSTCHVTTKHFEDFYAQCRKAGRQLTTFCAITLGAPNPEEGEIKIALKEEIIANIKQVIPVWDPSKGSLMRREVKETCTRYKVLHSVEGCSLLQLQPMTVFRDQLLVHCVLRFCPVLGDHTYSARVAKILGQNIYVPFDIALPKTQRVEEKLLAKMRYSSQQMHRMPLHLHLHQLLMPDDVPGKYPTHLTAPPPPFFQRTMELLGLQMIF